MNASKNIRKATSLPRRPQVEGNGPFGIPKESRETRPYFSRDEESRPAKERASTVFACLVFVSRIMKDIRVRGELLILDTCRYEGGGGEMALRYSYRSIGEHKTPLDKSLRAEKKVSIVNYRFPVNLSREKARKSLPLLRIAHISALDTSLTSAPHRTCATFVHLAQASSAGPNFCPRTPLRRRRDVFQNCSMWPLSLILRVESGVTCL